MPVPGDPASVAEAGSMQPLGIRTPPGPDAAAARPAGGAACPNARTVEGGTADALRGRFAVGASQS
eukprot:9375482-Alexandrium_andersonii.AAC.1